MHVDPPGQDAADNHHDGGAVFANTLQQQTSVNIMLK
jgi:hypothetical protein